ncbi:MAG: helix-turn-helix transcriptional regulator [Chloroflexota bacterium]|jgi:DeoR family suf operon transcriptional repressor|uniref:helix-turn-helix transcriptional regulator n=1 Tax=Bellilinea sp. TaxID=2838785 RepID=UPI002ADE5724|nr:winged helix-turn-helix transcriptional regulator [Bellilinea sp.]
MEIKSTRDKIMHTLLNNPRSTINELAEAVGINAISVRHHLNSMLADGVVASEEERHGVGRPRLVYYLTERGLEKFPTRYFRLANRLLGRLKETLPASAVETIFSEMARELAEDHLRETQNMSLEEKLDFLKKLLSEEGFIIEWEKIGDSYHIHEITCPYFHVTQAHPEVCAVDQTLISTVLSLPAQKIQCVLSGDHHCTYIIPLEKAGNPNHE